MTFELDKVVPWGRSFDEYAAMFSLDESDLNNRILGCGDGPASFNTEATKQGYNIVSADPLYRFSVEEIRSKIVDTAPVIEDQVRQNRTEFVWNYFESVEDLVSARIQAMEYFLEDLPLGLEAGRYVDASLPYLPFESNSFEIALCSHFLFLYSEQYSLEFHLDSIAEMCRVAKEVRIFPLLELTIFLTLYNPKPLLLPFVEYPLSKILLSMSMLIG